MVKIILTIVLMFCFIIPGYCQHIPVDLWKGIIAEETDGDYQVYLAIASVVHNRLKKGMDVGLKALERKDLDSFVKDNFWYVMNNKNINIIKTSQDAINEVFGGNKDYVNGAICYEHTKIYGVPKYTKKMKIVKIMYRGSKKEITFWR